MPVLCMGIETVTNGANRLMQNGELIYEEAQQVQRAVQALDWDAPGSAQFRASAEEVIGELYTLAEQGDTLGQRVRREVAEWLEVDGRYAATGSVQGAYLFAGGGSLLAGFSQRILEFFAPGYAARLEYTKQWQSLTLDERQELLQKQHDQIAEEYGLPPMKVRIEDLPDPFGSDARGVLRGGYEGELVLDVDNVKGRNALQVQETMAHETRHALQYYFIDHPDSLPPDISSEQVASWRENFEPGNYIKPRDDFERYRAQPVEADARDFGSQFSRDYFRQQAD